MRATTGRTSRPPAGLRTVLICENYEVVAELQAYNLRDGLNRFLRERPWLARPLVTGNVVSVDDEDDGVAREFYSKDPREDPAAR